MDWLAFLFSSSDKEEGYRSDAKISLLWSMQGISGRYPSGQRGQTVNLLPSASKVRILACPPKLDAGNFRVMSAE